jgi:hypothetical protein
VKGFRCGLALGQLIRQTRARLDHVLDAETRGPITTWPMAGSPLVTSTHRAEDFSLRGCGDQP